MIKTINDLKNGESGIIVKLSGNKKYMKRFLEMGFIPGVFVSLKKRAPFGDPLEIQLKNYNLAIRKSDASLIHIK